jgi:hypothetical protein
MENSTSKSSNWYYPLTAQLLELIVSVLLYPNDYAKLKYEIETFALGCEQVNHNKNDALQYFTMIADQFDRVVTDFMVNSEMQKLNKFGTADYDRGLVQKVFNLLVRLSQYPVEIAFIEERPQSDQIDVVFKLSQLEFITIVASRSRTGDVTMHHLTESLSSEAKLKRGSTLGMEICAAMFQVLAELAIHWRGYERR